MKKDGLIQIRYNTEKKDELAKILKKRGASISGFVTAGLDNFLEQSKEKNGTSIEPPTFTICQ